MKTASRHKSQIHTNSHAEFGQIVKQNLFDKTTMATHYFTSLAGGVDVTESNRTAIVFLHMPLDKGSAAFNSSLLRILGHYRDG